MDIKKIEIQDDNNIYYPKTSTDNVMYDDKNTLADILRDMTDEEIAQFNKELWDE